MFYYWYIHFRTEMLKHNDKEWLKCDQHLMQTPLQTYHTIEDMQQAFIKCYEVSRLNYLLLTPTHELQWNDPFCS